MVTSFIFLPLLRFTSHKERKLIFLSFSLDFFLWWWWWREIFFRLFTTFPPYRQVKIRAGRKSMACLAWFCCFVADSAALIISLHLNQPIIMTWPPFLLLYAFEPNHYYPPKEKHMNLTLTFLNLIRFNDHNSHDWMHWGKWKRTIKMITEKNSPIQPTIYKLPTQFSRLLYNTSVLWIFPVCCKLFLSFNHSRP